MSISSDQRYYLKQKALYYFYEKGYSNTDIAKMLGISRVTLNRLMAEAREEGMIRIEIIDTKNLKHILELEDALKSRFNLSYVKLVDVNSDDADLISSKLAAEGAKHLDRCLRNNMKIGLGWGKTLTNIISLLNPANPITGIEVYTLLGGACSEANFQPNVLAQSFASLYQGHTYIINAPFVCHSDLLCSEIKKEPSIERILNIGNELELSLIGIGREPDHEHLMQSYFHFPSDVIDEIIAAGAVGDICGNFIDENGQLCQTSVSDRVVSIDIEDLKKSRNVIAVAGGPTKTRSILGALRGGYIDVLITDINTATKLLADS